MTFLRILLVIAAALSTACSQLPKASSFAIPGPSDAAYSNPTSSVYIGNSFFYFNNGITSHVGAIRERSVHDNLGRMNSAAGALGRDKRIDAVVHQLGNALPLL